MRWRELRAGTKRCRCIVGRRAAGLSRSWLPREHPHGYDIRNKERDAIGAEREGVRDCCPLAAGECIRNFVDM